MSKSRLHTLAAYGLRRNKAFSPPQEQKHQANQEIYRELNDVVSAFPIPPKSGYLVWLLAILMSLIWKDDSSSSCTSCTESYIPSLQLVYYLIPVLALIYDVVGHGLLASRLRRKCDDLNKTYPESTVKVIYGFNFECIIIPFTFLAYFISPLKVSVEYHTVQYLTPVYIQVPPGCVLSEKTPNYIPSESAPTYPQSMNAPTYVQSENAPTYVQSENAPIYVESESAPTYVKSEMK